MSNSPTKTELASLNSQLGYRFRALVAARGNGVLLLAGRDLLARKSGEEWDYWPWEEIVAGGWRSDVGQLEWRTGVGENYEANLAEPGALPEVFRERMQAATVVGATHQVPGGLVQLVGRRPPEETSPITWYAIPEPGVNLSDPEVSAQVVTLTDQLSREYPN